KNSIGGNSDGSAIVPDPELFRARGDGAPLRAGGGTGSDTLSTRVPPCSTAHRMWAVPPWPSPAPSSPDFSGEDVAPPRSAFSEITTHTGQGGTGGTVISEAPCDGGRGRPSPQAEHGEDGRDAPSI